MPTDSEVLDTMIRTLASAEQEYTTLRKYAAIARKLESEEFVIVPRELTAENGAKAALTGEVQVRLREGQPWVPVSWAAIKELHRKMIAHFEVTAPQFQEEGRDGHHATES